MLEVNTVLMDSKGEPLPSLKKGDGGLTVRQACCFALTTQLQGDNSATGEQKFEQWTLSQRIWGSDKITLSAEEISLLKKMTGKIFSPAIVGPLWTLLDPALRKDGGKKK